MQMDTYIYIGWIHQVCVKKDVFFFVVREFSIDHIDSISYSENFRSPILSITGPGYWLTCRHTYAQICILKIGGIFVFLFLSWEIFQINIFIDINYGLIVF